MSFYGDGQADGQGTMITFSQSVPSAGMVVVTATITETSTGRAFVIIQATPP